MRTHSKQKYDKHDNRVTSHVWLPRTRLTLWAFDGEITLDKSAPIH